MKTQNIIKHIINFLKKSSVQKVLLILAIFVMAIFLFKDCGRTNNDDLITRYKQNITALEEDVQIERNKNKDLQYSKAVLAATNKTLKDLNTELADEVAKQKGKVIYISKINAELRIKIGDLENKNRPGSITVDVNEDGTQNVNWNAHKTYTGADFKIAGTAKIVFRQDTSISKMYVTDKQDTVFVKIPIIDEDSVVVSIPTATLNVDVVTGLERDTKTNKLKIFVRSDFEGFDALDINGTLIDPQKDDLIKSYFPRKRFVVGPVVGGGVGIIDGQFKAVPFVGGGIMIKIWEF